MKKTTRVKKASVKRQASRVKAKTTQNAEPQTIRFTQVRGERRTQNEKVVKLEYIPIYNSHGKEVEKYQLNKDIFNGAVNESALYYAVRMYNANIRQGNAATKTRGDVSGGGKKPWRQKGTGRARAGSTRSPLWRHGGVVFGPHPRDFHYSIPKKVKAIAFLSSLNSKLNENRVIGVDSIVISQPKTKKFKEIVDALKLKGKSLFVLDKIDENIKRSSKNLPYVSVRNCRDFNTMDVLRCDNVVVSKASLEKILERVS